MGLQEATQFVTNFAFFICVCLLTLVCMCVCVCIFSILKSVTQTLALEFYNIDLGNLFSTRDDFNSWGHLALSGDILGCHY